MSDENLGQRVDDAFRQLDEVEQLIVLAAMKALATKAFDFPAYEAFVTDRVARHRAGEELRVSDLETPPAPLAGLP